MGNCETITAKELIELIVSMKPKAMVVNDEDMYPTPKGEIETDDDGLCTLVVHPDFGSSLDMGNFLIDVGSVHISVERGEDGPEGEYEFDGKKIVYEDGQSVDDVIAAIKENVKFPEYDETQYTDTDFDPDDVEASVEVEDDDVFAKDEEGNVYRYSDEDEVPEDQEIIESDEAVHILVTAWSENGGEVSDEFTESWGPWS